MELRFGATVNCFYFHRFIGNVIHILNAGEVETMDIRKFGAYISKLRKDHDLTQSQLADLLNVTRQAVSKWEMGDSFPDISLLPNLSELFHITVDQLVNHGEPCRHESNIMIQIAKGRPEKVADMLHNQELPAQSVVNVAPMIKASTLDIISEGFGKHGIDIRHIVELAAYMNETGLTNLLKKASIEELDDSMLEKFIPFLDRESKDIIFSKIIDGELSSSLLAVMIPYLEMSNLYTLIDAAVLEGQLDADILKVLRSENHKKQMTIQKQGDGMIG
jgi:transcriptional regulator with XRE-family HTH domain